MQYNKRLYTIYNDILFGILVMCNVLVTYADWTLTFDVTPKVISKLNNSILGRSNVSYEEQTN